MSAPVVGLPTSASIQTATTRIFGQKTLAAGDTFTSDVLSQEGLPQANFYLYQSTAGALEMVPQFLLTPAIWLPYADVIVPVLDKPELHNYVLAAPQSRLQVQNTGGGPVTFYWCISATVPG